MVPPALLIRGSCVNITSGLGGGGLLRNRAIVIDWDELPDPACFKPSVMHDLDLVGHDGSVTVGSQVFVVIAYLCPVVL